MTREQATDFFAELFYGKHHIPPGGVHQYDTGWCVNYYGDLATYDSDMLTRLVLLAHDKIVRAAIEQSGPRMVKICIWGRANRDGKHCWERHPTIEEALGEWRKYHREEK